MNTSQTYFDQANPNGDAQADAHGGERGRRQSVTARIVCAARGIGVSDELRDPSARALSSGWVAGALRWFEQPSVLSAAARLTLRTLSLGLIDHNTVRMAVVDQYVRDWVAEGCQQVVILGAGLDARAFRMPELAGAHVFEVDHAASQHGKRQRAEGLLIRSKRLSYVVADLCDAGLSDALTAAGFEPEVRTAWVCEGVAAYLDVESIGRLMQGVSRLSAPGSHLAMSYVAPSEASKPEVGTSKKGFAARLVARLGEPARGWIDAADMQRLVQSAGLRLQEDITWAEWTRRVPAYRPTGTNLLKERLVIASKGVRH